MRKSICITLLIFLLLLSGCSGGNSGGGKSEYTLKINKIGTGVIAVDPVRESYPAGSTVKITASAPSGYLFRYFVDGKTISSKESISIVMNSDKQINAVFVKEMCFRFIGEARGGKSYRFNLDLCKMKRETSGGFSSSDFYFDAQLYVNSSSITRLSSEVELSPGSNVALAINHQSIGNIAASLTCPETVTGFGINPQSNIDSWLNGSQKNLSFSWNKVKCDYYMVWMRFHDEEGETIGGLFGAETLTNSTTISEEDLNWIKRALGAAPTYMSAYVLALCKKDFSEYFDSYFELESFPSNIVTNLPSQTYSRMNNMSVKSKTPTLIQYDVRDLTGKMIKKQCISWY